MVRDISKSAILFIFLLLLLLIQVEETKLSNRSANDHETAPQRQPLSATSLREPITFLMRVLAATMSGISSEPP